MHRVLVAKECVQQDLIVIHAPDTLHYLCEVLRLKVGDPLECFDGQGVSYTGTVRMANRDRLEITVGRTFVQERPAVDCALVLSLIKMPRFEWAIQKATELGVKRIYPLLAERSIVRPDAVQASGKYQRWARIAAEAARQSGRSELPKIEKISDLETVLAQLRGQDMVLPTLEVEGQSIHEVLGSLRDKRRIALLIGPEGDFSKAEVLRMQAQGAHTVSLGSNTLRSETAAVALLAITQFATQSL